MTLEQAKKKAMELVPCTCGGYGKEGGRHLTDCPRHGIAWEDIAAAIREAWEAGRESAMSDLKAVLDSSPNVEVFMYPNGDDANYAIRLMSDADDRPRCFYRRLGCDVGWLIQQAKEAVTRTQASEAARKDQP